MAVASCLIPMYQTWRMAQVQHARWLMLIHQLPHNPAYLRVKIGRRLAALGALALKSSVYLLPYSAATTEDFQWIRREILQGGGDATIVQAALLEGVTDEQLEEQFRAARDQDFAELAADARRLSDSVEGDDELPGSFEMELGRLEKRLAEISAIDYFGGSQRETAAGLVAGLRRRLQPPSRDADAPRERPRGCTWVTRAGVHVDRIASAWLVRRFIDTEATFKFVPAKGYVPAVGELRFDMYEAEFTHEGDQCTFEVLCRRFQLEQPGLEAIAEIVHDIDLKDNRYGRPETPGVARMIAGICLIERDDVERLRRGFELLDGLLLALARSAPPTPAVEPPSKSDDQRT